MKWRGFRILAVGLLRRGNGLLETPILATFFTTGSPSKRAGNCRINPDNFKTSAEWTNIIGAFCANIVTAFLVPFRSMDVASANAVRTKIFAISVIGDLATPIAAETGCMAFRVASKNTHLRMVSS